MPRDVWGTHVSPNDYKEAAKKGISKNTLNHRIANGWKAKDAITVPVKRVSEEYKRFRNLAISNGIKAGLFRSRLYIGWTLEEAANTPMFSNKERAIKGGKARKRTIPESAVKEAEKNGIGYSTLRSRVQNGMPMSEAVSIPPGGWTHPWVAQNKLIFNKQN